MLWRIRLQHRHTKGWLCDHGRFWLHCCCACRSSPFTFSLFSSTRALTLLPTGKLNGEHTAVCQQAVHLWQ